MDRNQPVTTYRHELLNAPVSPERSVRVMREAKSVNVTNNFGLTSHVVLKRGNCSKEIASRSRNNSLCQTSNVF